MDWLQACLPGLPVAPGIWVGADNAPAIDGMTVIAANQARRWLGQELNCVVWDGWQGNPPDGLAALAGTLAAGGLLFWLMPPLAQWPDFRDPDYPRVGLDSPAAHGFLSRLARVVADDPSVIRLQPATNPLPALPDLPLAKPPFRAGATPEQTRLVDSIVRVGQGRRRRPLVITADRGRGKSAAMGMAAARLIAEGRQQVVVTANEPGAVETLLRHAEPAAAAGQVRFFTVEDLLVQQPDAELIMVDEAASVPPYRLRQILLGWPRVVFASTVHGYEGAGRGFSVRFRGTLDRETPHWKAESLQAPIRWADSDPLEPLISRLFLLNARAPDPPVEDPGTERRPDEDRLQLERWYPGSADDRDLKQGFGLLVDAHYRTTPSDLRQWMDDPAAVSWRARLNGVLVGVLWATVEGGLDEALANQVMLGQRRVRGHLLPQSLAVHGGFPEAARQRLLRVVRIAVSARARQHGIGSALVQAARNHAIDAALDGLGTSFGGNPELLGFWQRNGLMPVRPGLSRESSSGELPLQMLCGLSGPGRTLTANLRRRLTAHWPTLVPRVWSDLDDQLLMQLTASLPLSQSLTSDDWRDLHSFAFGHRGFDLALPVLLSLAMTEGFARWLIDKADASGTALWARAVLQGWDWSRLRHEGVSRGRDDAEGRLRALVQAFLQDQ